MTDIYSCSLYCERPACIKVQRDKFRDELTQPEQADDKFCDTNCVWTDHHPACKYAPATQGGNV